MTYFIIICYILFMAIFAYLRRAKNAKELQNTMETQSNTSPNMNHISNIISESLASMELGFYKSGDDKHEVVFRLPIQLENVRADLVIIYKEGGSHILTFIKNPVIVPKLLQNKIYQFIGMLNYNISLGAFEMDQLVGCIHFRSTLHFTESHELKVDRIKDWLRDSCRMMDNTFPNFSGILFADAIPSDVMNKILNRVDPKYN